MTEEQADAAWSQLKAWLIDLSKIIVAFGIVGGALIAGTRYALRDYIPLPDRRTAIVVADVPLTNQPDESPVSPNAAASSSNRSVPLVKSTIRSPPSPAGPGARRGTRSSLPWLPLPYRPVPAMRPPRPSPRR